ncbi:DUF3800 domain-containing protein [bacterium]|nr:DUF3800 domain-containing protein [bacterium]
MTNSDYTHVAFADESNWNQGRFRSISLVTAAVEDARAFHRELDTLRQSHGRTEYKWKKTKRAHGIALADFFFARHDRMQVDVLVWDIKDSRHGGLRGRDDKANFTHMYYHLLHNVLKRHGNDGTRWLICPDVQKEVDWLTLEQCLGWKSWAVERNLFTQCGESGVRDFHNIHEIRCVCSKEYLMVQLVDLFAGLAAYSYAAFDKYQQWKIDQDATPSLFGPCDCGIEKLTLSNSDNERLPILHHVRQESGKRRLQVSLDSSNGLCTKTPINPLNFWLYTPQRANDRAPLKSAR